MLRIITERQGLVHRLTLHGAIASEWIGVLERHWHELLQQTAPANVHVVMIDVTFIDPSAEPLLRKMAAAGARFAGDGVMNRYVIEKISR